jgi:serine/threonine protein kinase
VADEELAEFVAGGLSPHLRARIEAHLDDCETCRVLVSELARSDSEQSAPLVATNHGPLKKRIGRYCVLEPLGMGACGVVLAAHDPELDRRVALKLLREIASAGEQRSEARERLLREARAMARVTHPNVVGVYDVGTFDDQVFVAMDLVEGQTLRSFLASHTLPLHEVLELFVQAGKGLWAAHGAGLVHRDFKPDNVLVGDDGRVRVTDFGLASVHAQPTRAADQVLDSGVHALGVSLTVSGVALGTPRYMAPEQHLSASVDARADQFAFAVALYEGLTGEHPFPALAYGELKTRVLSGHIEPCPAFQALPAPLQDCLRRALQTRPEERYPTMEELLRDLSIPGPIVQPRTVRKAAWLVLVFAALAVGLVLALWAPERKQRADQAQSSPAITQHPAVRNAPVRSAAPPKAPTEAPKVPAPSPAAARSSDAKALLRPTSGARAAKHSHVRRDVGDAPQPQPATELPAASLQDPTASTRFVGPRLKAEEF